MEDSPLMPEPIWIPPNGGYGWVVVMASFLSMVPRITNVHNSILNVYS